VSTTIPFSGSSINYLARWKPRNLRLRGAEDVPAYTGLSPIDDEDRNVSAEIFVVCRHFRAPNSIDPKFLDPKHVFKDVDASTSLAVEKGTSTYNAHANVFQPEKKRRRRDGYEEGDYTLFRKISAGDFVQGPDPILALGMANKLSFETQEEKGFVTVLFSHNYFISPPLPGG
jgi:hypothetical protein